MIPDYSAMLLSHYSYAGAMFADACLKGLNGVPDVVECSYVQSSITELPFFSSKVINLTFYYENLYARDMSILFMLIVVKEKSPLIFFIL